MRVKRRGVESSMRDGVHGFAHARDVNARVTFVSVDDLEPAPVPQLQVDLARPALVIAGDDETPSLARQLGGQVEWLLFAGGFDYQIAASALSQSTTSSMTRL